MVGSILLVVGVAMNLGNDAGMKAMLRVDDLRCEYLVNPIGVDEVTPRLSWKPVALDQRWQERLLESNRHRQREHGIWLLGEKELGRLR